MSCLEGNQPTAVRAQAADKFLDVWKQFEQQNDSHDAKDIGNRQRFGFPVDIKARKLGACAEQREKLSPMERDHAGCSGTSRPRAAPNLAEHQEVDQRFLCARGCLDVSSAMTKPVGKTRQKPDWQNKIHQDKDGGIRQHGRTPLERISESRLRRFGLNSLNRPGLEPTRAGGRCSHSENPNRSERPGCCSCSARPALIQTRHRCRAMGTGVLQNRFLTWAF